MGRCNYEKTAADFAAVIMELSRKPRHLDNLEGYLARHFAVWMEKHASTPEDLVEDLQMFANLELDEYEDY